MKKKIRRTLHYIFGKLSLRMGYSLGFLFPLIFLRMWGLILGRIFYYFSKKFRTLAENNLRFALGDKEESELLKINKEAFSQMGKGVFETLWYVSHADKKRRKIVAIEGKEKLDKALSCAQGVIGMTAHIGAFTILGGVLALEGYKVNYILRTPRDERFSALLGMGLRMQGVKPIFTYPPSRCVEQSIDVLRHNEILIVLIDQDMGGSGVFIDFFGRVASTAVGPVIFALRTGAKILPMFIIREDKKHKLLIRDPLNLNYEDRLEKTIINNTQRLTKIVEEMIRGYPQAWSWIDRRWKTQPQKFC